MKMSWPLDRSRWRSIFAGGAHDARSRGPLNSQSLEIDMFGSAVADPGMRLSLGVTMKTVRLVAVLGFSLLAFAGSAGASSFALYGTGTHNQVDSLFSVNTATGATTVVGATGALLGAGGLAYDGGADILYATGFVPGQSGSAMSLF